jgi:hypothetical protein
MTSLQFTGHVCSIPGRCQENNTRIVGEIEELADEYASKVPNEGQIKPVLEPIIEDEPDKLDFILAASSESIQSVKRAYPGKRSPNFFKERVRKYVKARRNWNKDVELSLIYKNYFTPPRCRFNVIPLAGDILIAKAALEANVNKQFADHWFKGTLDLITHCVTIE